MSESETVGVSGTQASKKEKPTNVVIPPKKPKLSKAERRALQEQQRAAKASGGPRPTPPSSTTTVSKGGSEPLPSSHQQQQQHSLSTKPESNATITTTTNSGSAKVQQEQNSKTSSKQIALLAHLPPYKDPKDHPDQFLGVQLGATTNTTGNGGARSTSNNSNQNNNNYTELHPSVLKAGLQFCTDPSCQGNARCRVMLYALSDAIRDYQPKQQQDQQSKQEQTSLKELSNDTTNTTADIYAADVRYHFNTYVLKPSFTYWTNECRPHSVAMGNAFTFVKSAVAALDRDFHAMEDAKLELISNMNRYIQERIDYADLAMAQVANTKICDGDVILTYGNYEVIPIVLMHAAQQQEDEEPKEGIPRQHEEEVDGTKQKRRKQFRVIVVDSKPLLEGKALVRTLRAAGLDCTYVLLNALSFVMMKDVTKILLGAEALMNDGSVYSRVGTACIAMMASANRIVGGVPVLVCAETYKISNRVQLESITNNELGNPQNVVKGDLVENLRVINILYDLTPAEFISGIITEMGIIPPTSVAVLLREMNPQEAYNGGF